MLTIEEPAGISGTSAWMPSIGPVTLMSKVWCQVSRVTCGSRSRAATPALLTSASTRPCSDDSHAASAAQPASSVTSSCRWTTPSAAGSSNGSTSVATTVAPSAASAATSAAP